MATHDQLEIIREDGQVEFYPLDPGKGVTNIGRHPDNDIVLDDPGVDSVHAMLDHRQWPYQLVVFSRTGQVVLDGERLSHNMIRTLQNWSTMTLGDQTLIFIKGSPGPGGAGSTAIAPRTQQRGASGGGTGPGAASRSRPFQTAQLPPPQTRPEVVQPNNGHHRTPSGSQMFSLVDGSLNTRPPDQLDDWIVTEFPQSTWQIDVDQQEIGQLLITNGGPLVAHFHIEVYGLDREWVEINPPVVELKDGESRTVSLALAAPRAPGSRAKAHHFVIEVTSHDYPDRVSSHGATLIINPYYQFAVTEVSPKRQTVSYYRHVGEASVSVTNLGNSAAMLRLEGSDEEHACYYEFDLPGETVPLVHQAEFQLQPEETLQIPIRIVPLSRRLIGLRKRLFRYTVTVSQIAEQPFSRSTIAELKSAPLIGPLWILLICLIFLILLLILIRPRLNVFMFTEGGQRASISNQTPVAMRWEASIFTTDLSMEPAPENLPQPMPRRGTVEAFPTASTSYEMTGHNILSRFAPAIFPAPVGTVQVQVNPIAPQVNFSVEPSQILGEGEITLNWSVDRADKIELLRQIGDGAPEFISDVSGQPAGSLIVTPEPNQARISYILRASNAYVSTPTPAAGAVTIQTPTPTVPPTPAVQFFTANPIVINEGEASTLSWQVNNTEQVTLIYPDGSQFPLGPQGNQMVQPLTPGNYILNPGGGGQPRNVFIEVIPATPTPTTTPVPNAPVIEVFAVSDTELIQGKADSDEDETEVEVQWQVSGTVTNIELNAGPDLGTYSNLRPADSLNLTVDKNTVFVLTAFNQDKTDSQTAQIEVVEATATPEPEPTDPPPPTPLPPPNIFFFTADPVNPAQDIVSCNNSGTQCDVEADSDVRFSWQVIGAENVTLSGFGNVGPADTKSLQDVSGAEDGDYTLTAINIEGTSSNQTITINVVPKPPPSPPTNVRGIDGAQNRIQWDEPFTNPGSVVGYRVKRAPKGSTNYQVVSGDLAASARDWPDPSFGCGQVYYVVALYYNDTFKSNLVETPQSSDSTWASQSCP